MRQFGKASRKDTWYVVTTRSGEIVRVKACRVVPIKTDTDDILLYFHSNSYSANPVVFNAKDIIGWENEGKVIGVGNFILSCLGGGCAGGITWMLMKNMITCTIKNAFLNKTVTVVVIGGITYVVSSAFANMLADQSSEFTDYIGYFINRSKDIIAERLSKKDEDIKEVGNDEEEK